MRDPFLLCDPGLLLPPCGESVEHHQEFWRRLLAWSADRRLRLGLQGRAAVLDYLRTNGWPDFSPPHCPDSIARDARRAVNEMLASVAHDPPNKASEVPELNPTYTKDADCGVALAIDIAEQHDKALVATASEEEHWDRSSDAVALDPPPPEMVPLNFAPNLITAAERDLKVAKKLAEMRIRIIGGLRKPAVETALEERFSLEGSKIEWIESEEDSEPQVERLGGIRPERDIVVCVTRFIGHAGSEKVREVSTRRGIEPLMIERRSAIADALQARYG
jgi:hypothetical protein